MSVASEAVKSDSTFSVNHACKGAFVAFTEYPQPQSAAATAANRAMIREACILTCGLGLDLCGTMQCVEVDVRVTISMQSARQITLRGALPVSKARERSTEVATQEVWSPGKIAEELARSVKAASMGGATLVRKAETTFCHARAFHLR